MENDAAEIVCARVRAITENICQHYTCEVVRGTNTADLEETFISRFSLERAIPFAGIQQFLRLVGRTGARTRKSRAGEEGEGFGRLLDRWEKLGQDFWRCCVHGGQKTWSATLSYEFMRDTFLIGALAEPTPEEIAAIQDEIMQNVRGAASSNVARRRAIIKEKFKNYRKLSTSEQAAKAVIEKCGLAWKAAGLKIPKSWSTVAKDIAALKAEPEGM